MKYRHYFYHWLTITIALCAIGFVWINDYQISITWNHIYYRPEELPQAQAVMILWASVRSDWTLSRILKDRADMAIIIYQMNKADRILISADNSTSHYDETRAIRNYLVSQWINTWDIFLDFAWFDTYDSMYRAHHIFQVQSLIIATQKFHQPRSVYLARQLGIEAHWIVSDTRIYRDDLRNNLREMIARVKAWFDIQLWSSAKFGGEVVPITGESNGTQ